MHPPSPGEGPGEAPLGADFKHFKNIFQSTVTGDSGSNARIASGDSLPTTWGRLAWRNWNVASVPGARDAPVRHCLAREISPNLIFWQAAAALRGSLPHLEHWTGAPPATNQPTADLSNLRHNSSFPTLVARRSPKQHGRQMNNFQPLVYIRVS